METAGSSGTLILSTNLHSVTSQRAVTGNTCLQICSMNDNFQLITKAKYSGVAITYFVKTSLVTGHGGS
jgi:hypothetical protein